MCPYKKIELDGWVDIDKEGEAKNNIPKACPKCGKPLWKTNALQLCGILMVGCKDYKCRWAEVFTE